MLRLARSSPSLRLASSVKANARHHTALQNVAARGGNSAFTRFPVAPGSLYSKDLEKDSCGVGLVAHLKKQASRQILLDANEMLVRMSHRGGCGCEPNTGDGAGILVGMPDAFYRRVMRDANLPLPAGPNSYGTGLVFLPKSNDAFEAIKWVFETQTKQNGFNVLGWRAVQTDNSALGDTAKSTEPRIEQVFVGESRGGFGVRLLSCLRASLLAWLGNGGAWAGTWSHASPLFPLPTLLTTHDTSPPPPNTDTTPLPALPAHPPPTPRREHQEPALP